MNFDYTYITLFGVQVFEPITILTNVVFFVLSWYFFLRLRKFDNEYARHMGLFIFLLGVSALFGAIGHGIHHQYGMGIFNATLFLMNVFSLIAIYYCFLAPFIYVRGIDERSKKYLNAVRIWVLVLITLSLITGNFLLIKVNAGIVLLYSLLSHLRAHKTKTESGNRTVVVGIVLAFVPIIIHSLRFSIHEWFNYKDLSHVAMSLSLAVIFWGAFKNASELEKQLPSVVDEEEELETTLA